jgi:hypothetical protein
MLTGSIRRMPSAGMIPPPDRGAPTDPGAWPEEFNRLDVAVYRAIAATPTPALDLAFRRLSREADFQALACQALWCCSRLAGVHYPVDAIAGAVNGGEKPALHEG